MKKSTIAIIVSSCLIGSFCVISLADGSGRGGIGGFIPPILVPKDSETSPPDSKVPIEVDIDKPKPTPPLDEENDTNKWYIRKITDNGTGEDRYFIVVTADSSGISKDRKLGIVWFVDGKQVYSAQLQSIKDIAPHGTLIYQTVLTKEEKDSLGENYVSGVYLDGNLMAMNERHSNRNDLTFWSECIEWSFADGNGSPQRPYIIETAPQLAYFAYMVNSGQDLSKKFFKLNADIDLKGIEWKYIGYTAAPFTGNFDGDGHTISNLMIYTQDVEPAGFFSVIGGGTVRNLNFAQADVLGSEYVGILAGKITSGVVENCTVNGVVAGVYNVGGLAGCNSALIQNSATNVNVIGWDNLGGLVGVTEGESQLQGCFIKGIISGVSRVGGLAGVVNGGQCFKDLWGSTIAIAPTEEKCGGVVGELNVDVIFENVGGDVTIDGISNPDRFAGRIREGVKPQFINSPQFEKAENESFINSTRSNLFQSGESKWHFVKSAGDDGKLKCSVILTAGPKGIKKDLPLKVTLYGNGDEKFSLNFSVEKKLKNGDSEEIDLTGYLTNFNISSDKHTMSLFVDEKAVEPDFSKMESDN